MYDYFRGYITDKKKTVKGCFVTIDIAGIGYLLEVPEHDYINIKISEEITSKIYVLLSHREDLMSLFGFLTKETRDIFQILLSVSGVGAKMAIALLNEFDACDLIALVIEGNFKELTRAKGVGPKLAQKIILELKDKLIKTDLPRTQATCIPQSQAVDDTQAVLLSLGYEEKEINDAISKILPTLDNCTNSEEVLRKVLTLLSM